MRNLLVGFGFGVGVVGLLGVIASVEAMIEQPVLEFFHGEECPHCHEEREWFPELKQMYPVLEIREFEVWHDANNRKLWEVRMAELGVKPSGVPTNIFEGKVIVGFDKAKILAAIKSSLGSPKGGEVVQASEEEVDSWRKYLQSSWPVMSFMLGLLDGFNPCAMWSLMILLGFLLTMDDRKKMWLVGGVFIGSSGILYFGALLGYLFGFSEISALVASSVMSWVFRIVGAFAVVMGGLSLWSARNAQIDCSVRNAKSKKRFQEKLLEILEREKLWLVLAGIVGLAFTVNAIELLCSLGIPTAFTATLISMKLSLWTNLSAILIYDIAYMLDDLVVFLLAMWTMSLTVFSPRIVQASHFLGGLVLLGLGVVLLWNPTILAV